MNSKLKKVTNFIKRNKGIIITGAILIGTTALAIYCNRENTISYEGCKTNEPADWQIKENEFYEKIGAKFSGEHDFPFGDKEVLMKFIEERGVENIQFDIMDDNMAAVYLTKSGD